VPTPYCTLCSRFFTVSKVSAMSVPGLRGYFDSCLRWCHTEQGWAAPPSAGAVARVRAAAHPHRA
jgi:hypothetical protein